MSHFTVIPSHHDQSRFDQLAAKSGGVFYRECLLPESDALQQYAIVAGDGQWIGGFQLYRLKLKGVPTLSVAPWHPHCGLFALPRQGGKVAQQTYRKHIAETVAKFLRTVDEKLLSVPLPPEWVDVQSFIWEGFHCTVKYTYQLSLETADPSALLSAKTRNSIRKAEKEGLEVAQTTKLNEVWQGLSASAKRKGFEVNKSRLQHLMEGTKNGDCIALVAKLEGRFVASAVMVHDGKTAYYLLGGVDRENSVQGGLAVLVDHAIKTAQSKGCKVFDFEGSMIPEVEQFVRSFGGEIQPYYVVARSPLWMVPLLRSRGKSEF